MMDAFDRHGWFFTEHDTTFGIGFTPILVPDDADSTTRTLALELYSRTGIKEDSVVVRYGAFGVFPNAVQMAFDSSVGPNGAYVGFLSTGGLSETFLNYYVSAVNKVNGAGNPGVTCHWPKSAPELDYAKFWVGETLERRRYSSTGSETIPAGQSRTAIITVPGGTGDFVRDLNVHLRVERDGAVVPMAEWQIEDPHGRSARLIFNRLKNQVSWPYRLDIWFDDERDAPHHHFATWDFDLPGFPQESPLSALEDSLAAGEWRLVVNNTSGDDIILDQWELQVTTRLSSAGVEDGGAPPARESWVGKARPNPFNPMSVIPFYVAGEEDVSFRIYDVAGRLVRVLLEGRFRPGPYQVKWDGRGDRGVQVPSGVYFYRAQIGRRHFHDKAVILK
jgi:hypothetical protein